MNQQITVRKIANGFVVSTFGGPPPTASPNEQYVPDLEALKAFIAQVFAEPV